MKWFLIVPLNPPQLFSSLSRGQDKMQKSIDGFIGLKPIFAGKPFSLYSLPNNLFLLFQYIIIIIEALTRPFGFLGISLTKWYMRWYIRINR